MQGFQECQPELFVIANIEQMIPKNHLLRKIDKSLNLSFVRKLTAHLYCENNGRPSVDPETYFRMQLIAYFYGIDSDRRLCEEVTFNLAYRWYCKFSLQDEVPDHSSMTRIRDRLGEETFKKVFEEIVEICRKNGLVKAKSVMIDASLVKADAVLNSLVPKNATPEEIEKRPSMIQGNHYKNQTHQSCSDPDASLAGKAGVAKGLYYKLHQTIDSESKVILDPHVTTGSISDGTQFIERIEAVEESTGTKIKEVIADRGYGGGENQEYLIKRKINSNVPNFHGNAGQNYDREKFIIGKDKSKMTCPAGHNLNLLKVSDKHPTSRTYQIRGGHCNLCPFRPTCFPKKPTGDDKGLRKKIHLSVYQPIQDQIRLKERTPEFKANMTARMWKLEGLFAEAKNWHNLSRARYRGLSKMQIQAYLTASVQNVKRLVVLVLLYLTLKFQKFEQKVFINFNFVHIEYF
jgi:transposase